MNDTSTNSHLCKWLCNNLAEQKTFLIFGLSVQTSEFFFQIKAQLWQLLTKNVKPKTYSVPETDKFVGNFNATWINYFLENWKRYMKNFYMKKSVQVKYISQLVLKYFKVITLWSFIAFTWFVVIYYKRKSQLSNIHFWFVIYYR